jgi:hypothetical protein
MTSRVSVYEHRIRFFVQSPYNERFSFSVLSMPQSLSQS